MKNVSVIKLYESGSGSWFSSSKGTRQVSLISSDNEIKNILSKISIWSPHIFMLVLKVSFGYTKLMLL